jgi:hypothetical protein
VGGSHQKPRASFEDGTQVQHPGHALRGVECNAPRFAPLCLLPLDSSVRRYAHLLHRRFLFVRGRRSSVPGDRGRLCQTAGSQSTARVVEEKEPYSDFVR